MLDIAISNRKQSLKSVWNIIDNRFLILSVFHWLLSFITDKSIFRFNVIKALNCGAYLAVCKYVFIKLMYLLMIVLLWQIIGFCIKGVKNGNQNIKKYLHFTLIYFSIMFVLLILTWPGIWRWDEFNLLKAAQNLEMFYWFTYISSFVYIFSLMIIPFPAGIVFVQICIISLIVGYIIFKLDNYLLGSKFTYLMYLPFLLLPIIDHNLFPLRHTLYSYVELLFIVKLLFLRLDKRDIKAADIIFLSFLTAVLSIWRADGIYYLFLAPILFIIFFNKIYKFKTIAVLCIITIAFTIILYIPQYIGNSKKSLGYKYKLISIAGPLADLVKAEYDSPEAQKDLKNIDRVISIKALKESERGLYAVNSKNADYSKDDYKKFLRSYINLIIKNPRVFLKNRLNYFLETHDLTENSAVIFDSSTLKLPRYSFILPYLNDSNMIFSPINIELRKKVIQFLECSYPSLERNNIKLSDKIYSCLPGIAALLIVLIIVAFKKKIASLALFLIVLVRVPLVFITAPETHFMYYMPVYLCGFFFMFLLLAQWLFNKNSERKIDLFV
ncbi:MAG: hypothetical protein ACM3KR_07270 [Deltaproteobacteria bacterium]